MTGTQFVAGNGTERRIKLKYYYRVTRNWKAEMNLRTPKTLRVIKRSRMAASAITIRCRRPSQRLRALNRFSKSLRFFEKRALRRAVLPHRGRHSPALHFASLRPRACAGLRKVTSAVRALDCGRQRAGADAAARRLFLIFIFLIFIFILYS